MAQQTAQFVSIVSPRTPRFPSALLSQTFDFPNAGASTIAYNTQLDVAGLGVAQSVFIDNRNNGSAVSLLFPDVGEFIVAPPQSQGFYPILFLGPNLNVIASTAGNVAVPCKFLNDAVTPFIWYVNGPLSGAVTITGTVSVQNVTGTYTNRSTSLGTGGAPQTVAAANGARKKLVIKNPPTAATQNIANAEPLFINFTSNASAFTLCLLPGESWVEGLGNACSTESLSVYAATTGHFFVVYEM